MELQNTTTTMNTIDLFEAVKNENTDKGKKELLKQANEFSKWVFKQTFDPSIKYYIKQLPEHKSDSDSDSSLSNQKQEQEQEQLIKDTLNEMLSKKIRGNMGYDMVETLLDSLNSEYANLVIGILTKNLYVDVGPKTLLDVFGKDFFFVPPYMRCKTQADITRITYPALIQLKADGAFINIIIEPLKDKVTFMTRNGNILDLPVIESKVLDYCKFIGINEDIVLNGEMMVSDTSLDNRSEGNGLVNKLINRESSLNTLDKKIKEAKTQSAHDKLVLEKHNKIMEYDAIESKIYIECWDIISYNNWKEGYEPVLYSDRFNKLQKLFRHSATVSVIETKLVYSQQEALEFYNDKKDLGLEGAVVKQITPTKDITTYWKDHTSPGQVKLKGLHVVEMKCIGYSLGDENSPFKNFLGNLICETSDGLFQAKISGLAYKDKGILVNPEKWSEAILNEQGEFQLNNMYESLQDFFDNVFKDKIISVQFNDVSISKDKKPSLQFAQYKGIRNDSNNVDTLHYILEMTNKLDKVEL